jgi:hypothetical protein
MLHWWKEEFLYLTFNLGLVLLMVPELQRTPLNLMMENLELFLEEKLEFKFLETRLV